MPKNKQKSKKHAKTATMPTLRTVSYVTQFISVWLPYIFEIYMRTILSNITATRFKIQVFWSILRPSLKYITNFSSIDIFKKILKHFKCFKYVQATPCNSMPCSDCLALSEFQFERLKIIFFDSFLWYSFQRQCLRLPLIWFDKDKWRRTR